MVNFATLIFQIENGELRKEEYDMAVATFDIAPELIPIRHLMKDILPNKAKGMLPKCAIFAFIYTNGRKN